MRLKLRTAERNTAGDLEVQIYELHPSYTMRIVQGLIDRSIELSRAGKPEPFKLLLANKQRLELSADQFAKFETLAIMDDELSAPPADDEGEGPETM